MDRNTRTTTGLDLDRRRLLLGSTTLALAGGLLNSTGALNTRAWAQTKPQRIDVHHHVAPPLLLAALKKAKLDTPPHNTWTPERSLEAMDKAGVTTSMLSPFQPQAGFLGPEEAASVCRDSNEYTLKLMGAHPGRFGLFAMLPLPHVDESLKEIAYAFDVLKADGIGMMTSYSDKWLGHPDFVPVLEELNRRKALVYTHPTNAKCCVNLVQGVFDNIVEYGADTTRTIASLILSGRSQAVKDITWIFSHGGGVLTAVAERLQIQAVNTPPYKGKLTRAIVDGELQRFYYDTAQISNAVTLDALMKLVPTSQLVFGSDYPYRTPLEHVTGLTQALNAADLKAVDRDNALRLLPRLRAV